MSQVGFTVTMSANTTGTQNSKSLRDKLNMTIYWKKEKGKRVKQMNSLPLLIFPSFCYPNFFATISLHRNLAIT